MQTVLRTGTNSQSMSHSKSHRPQLKTHQRALSHECQASYKVMTHSIAQHTQDYLSQRWHDRWVDAASSVCFDFMILLMLIIGATFSNHQHPLTDHSLILQSRCYWLAHQPAVHSCWQTICTTAQGVFTSPTARNMLTCSHHHVLVTSVCFLKAI